MRDINRIDGFLEELKKIWKTYPDLRFGQMILNVINESNGGYWIEDDELIKVLKESYGIE